jgi:hypothetical protein
VKVHRAPPDAPRPGRRCTLHRSDRAAVAPGWPAP